MVIFAFAVPGRFGDWCDAMVLRMAETALGTVLAVGANSPEEMATNLIAGEGANFVIRGPQPGPWLCQILKTTQRPFTIALNDPRDAALDLIFRNELEMADAVRRVGGSCASLMSCITLPGALVLNASRDWYQPLAAARTIAAHFGLALADSDLERIIAETDAAGLGPGAEQPVAISDPRAETVTTIVGGAVAPYVEHFLGGPFGPITWARELFMADGHVPAVHAVDVTGRVRALLYGPYITLPPGDWAAEVVLGFSQEAMDVNFLVDVLVAGKQLGVTTIQPTREGIYSVNLSFVIAADNIHPLEFRVINEKPAFDGRVALGRITLRLQRDLPHLEDTLQEELGLID